MAYETKDSGEREEYPSGMVRDTVKGKPRYDLIDRDFLTRLAELCARGAEKYGEDNWRKANSIEELARFKASAFRHFIQYLDGETDEDHAAAVAWNIAAAEATKAKFSQVTTGSTGPVLGDETYARLYSPEVEAELAYVRPQPRQVVSEKDGVS